LYGIRPGYPSENKEWGSKGGSLPKNTLTSGFHVENRSIVGPQWFALRVKSHCEKTVAAVAHNKGFEAFLPTYVSCRRWSDRLKSIELPLFPGYLFCRMEPQHRFPLLTIPGVLQIVGIGKTPTPIEDHEIDTIRSIILSGLVVEPWPFLEVGRRVRLEAGPLTGFRGILIETAKDQRVVSGISLLQRSVAVSIEQRWVTPLDDDKQEDIDSVQPDWKSGSRQIPRAVGGNS
jgi:transcription antitermination factor NusG